MAARSKRRDPFDRAHDGGSERWLITYADMITLLMVLFIVLFAISQVDKARFEELKTGLAQGFGVTSSPFQGTEAAPLEDQGVSPMQPMPATLGGPETGKSGATTQQDKDHDADYQQAEEEIDRLEALRKKVLKALRAKGLARDVVMSIDRRGLRISMVSRHIVFHANLADLTPRGKRVLDTLAPVLREVPNQVDVDGHTNQVKVKPKFYPTDWELSAARAVTVLRYLQEHGRVPGSRLTALAHGHQQPLVDPSKPGSQRVNKRVDVVLLSGVPESARDLFQQVLSDRKQQAALGVPVANHSDSEGGGRP